MVGNIVGPTPPDIKEKCLHLCRDYLGGVWLNITVADIIVKRITGGLVNQLYYCGINEDKQTSDEKVPQEVSIRLYQNKLLINFNNKGYERLTDVIIAQLLSEKQLGPKIYGLFESGQIMKYYKHKRFRNEEQNNPKLVAELASKLARIHATDVPIRRTVCPVFNNYDMLYSDAMRLFDINLLVNECNCETLRDHNLSDELLWLRKTVDAVDSPIAFTHLDFRGGYDFGSAFADWGRLWDIEDTRIQFPTDNEIKPFVESYMKESVKIFGKEFTRDERNSLKNLIKEVKVFSLCGLMFYTLFTLKMNQSFNPDIPFDKKAVMQRTEYFYKNYYNLKERIIKENLLNKP
ncbi:unnamed protein product [Medioppia subpectinata]|uniref:Aminoglycoside phosphotransferase domain-containing protein n=1 Tax=Medioppia subpectinata TaxID=1979941 RepID=A0A7R9PV29_9ACAR|nr:unnamed protein product [Medioppia subpectinata]CAG2101433.1 unnamed protein product [Medioppia subpectinata]